MRRQRSKTISNVIIAKSDLKAIWALLERKASEDDRSATEAPAYARPPSRPEITVVSVGSMSTETTSDEIFDNDVIDLQKSLSVELHYTNYASEKNIRVQLRASNSSSLDSSFSISGGNPQWVDATFSEFERLCGAIKPQSDIFRRLRWLIFILLASAIGYSWFLIVDQLLPPNSGPIPHWVQIVKAHSLLRYAFLLAASFPSGVVPSWWLVAWVGKLWPSVEFDFGPEHLKQKKRLRGRLSVVAVVLVLPFAIDAFERYVFSWQ